MEPLPTPVYVAASSREMPRVDKVVSLIDADPSLKITYRWFDDMRAPGAKPEHQLTREEARLVARKCLWGVRLAEIVLLLYPYESTRGAWGELGGAIFDDKTLIVSHAVRLDTRPERWLANDPFGGAQIFTRLATAEILGDEVAVAAMKRFHHDPPYRSLLGERPIT